MWTNIQSKDSSDPLTSFADSERYLWGSWETSWQLSNHSSSRRPSHRSLQFVNEVWILSQHVLFHFCVSPSQLLTMARSVCEAEVLFLFPSQLSPFSPSFPYPSFSGGWFYAFFPLLQFLAWEYFPCLILSVSSEYLIICLYCIFARRALIFLVFYSICIYLAGESNPASYDRCEKINMKSLSTAFAHWRTFTIVRWGHCF